MINYTKRRNKVIKALKEDSVLLLFSGPLVKSSADGFYPFNVNKNFYYLTGINQHDSLLLITKTKHEVTEELFILPLDPLKAKWDGPRLSYESATKISGILNVFSTEDFIMRLEYLKGFEHFYFDFEEGIMSNQRESVKSFAEKHFKDKQKLDIYQTIIKLRMVKSPAEIKRIEQSINLTRKALLKAQKLVKTGVYEYEVAAKFLYEIKRFNGDLGFSTIVASGKNATILHYPTLTDKINDHELVLLDLGGHNNMYTADISRTYPANKKFTKEGELIYQIVLACNKAVINYIKPGLTLLDLQNFTKDFLKTELVKAKLLKEEEDVTDVYYHGVSHHLGLDTHDPSIRALPLEKGNVITVEPGLYFSKLAIGVRIEDNILVTKDGARNLSHRIPKEVEEITK